MKLSISNIAWEPENDEVVYAEMRRLGYQGLEIAPTRIFPKRPYEHLKEASRWSKGLFEHYHLVISSIQSIWYGKTERLFGTQQERMILLNYTKKAIDFASAIGCSNLVFGSPQNRNLRSGESGELAISFFKELGEYAVMQGTVLALEANPPMYQTNYINTTKEAIAIAKTVNSKGLRVNLDLGTVIANRETLSSLVSELNWIHHIHISEPNLKEIEYRKIHQELKGILKTGYEGYLSIEMRKGLPIRQVFKVMREAGDIFRDI